MGLYTALNTGATGLNSNQIMLETIGDNIANVNTTAFKSNRADLESQFALTLRGASGPGQPLGGTNPSQIGLGSNVGAIQRNFTQGQLSGTGVPSDLAIDGAGFFVLEDGEGGQMYTRDGTFQLNLDQQLQSRDGFLLQGHTASAAGDIDTTGPLGSLAIPLGRMTMVEATTRAAIDGNLSATDQPAIGGQIQYSQPLVTDAAGTPASASTALTSLVSPSGSGLFATGDSITVHNVLKGDLNLLTAPQQFTIGTDGSTVQDLLSYLEGVVGVNTTLEDAGFVESATGTTVTPGIRLDELGRIQVVSNAGAVNAVTLAADNLVNAATGQTLTAFAAPAQVAVGSGVTTEFTVYDSLGEPANLRVRLVMEGRDEATTTWRWFAESGSDSDVSDALGTGTLVFDRNGAFTGPAVGDPVSITLADRGSGEVQVALDFSSLTMLDDINGAAGAVRVVEVDGAPLGTLESYAIDDDGVITGAFTNGLTRTLGQVVLATFTNPNGLSLAVNNNYTATVNSGAVTVRVPNDPGAGRVQAGTLELSNVDLAREFIGLINASTGFSAASRVITTSDEMLRELMVLAR